MPKKGTKKKKTTKKKTSAKKKTTTRKTTKPQIIVQAPKQESINPVLIENFVSLQRVLTNLSVKMDGLTTQISKLLELFDISAKSLAEKSFEEEKSDKEMAQKLDNLLDQNKVLAKGLTLMHERIPREQLPPPTLPPPKISQAPMGMQPSISDSIPSSNPENKSMTREIPNSPPFSQNQMSPPPKPKSFDAHM